MRNQSSLRQRVDGEAGGAGVASRFKAGCRRAGSLPPQAARAGARGRRAATGRIIGGLSTPFPDSTSSSAGPAPIPGRAAASWIGRRARPVQALALWAMLALLGLGSLAWNLAAWPLLLLLDRASGRRIGRAAISRGYRLYWWFAAVTGMMRIDARALDALRDEPGLVVVANHPSMLDALLIVARLPRGFCVMKAGLVRNPFLGAGARLARYLRNDAPLGLLRRAVDELRAGGQLVLFPEGTRSEGPRVGRFRPGFALIAREAGVPVQTVIIDLPERYLGKGWPLWRTPHLPVRVTLRLGQRFEIGADTAAACAEIEAHVRSSVDARPAPPQ